MLASTTCARCPAEAKVMRGEVALCYECAAEHDLSQSELHVEKLLERGEGRERDDAG